MSKQTLNFRGLIMKERKMNIKLHRIDERYRKYAVIIVYEEGEFLLVKHSHRDTWEIPGGHHEKGETIMETAERELYEETGALKYNLEHIYDYSVEVGNLKNFGGLFRAKIIQRGALPDFEISEVGKFKELPSSDKMTYGTIQHQLVKLVEEGKVEDE